MQQGRPFARAILMARLIASMMRQPGVTQGMVHAQIGSYKSRGKGRGLLYVKKRCTFNHCNNGGYNIPHQNKREIARRARQKLMAHPMAVKLAAER